MTIYLFKYNNYYNRIVKRLNTVEEYRTHPDSLLIGTFEGVNFNPNDGIGTELILNFQGSGVPDYLIAADGNIIDSRWYVIEAVRTRAGQFKMTLYRDVIAEWYDYVIEAPVFIEKAWVGLNDPAIFNNEDMRFNQIKTSEKLIKDIAKCGWYVAYVAKNLGETEISVPKLPDKVDGSYAAFADYPYYQYASTPARGAPYDIGPKIYFRTNNGLRFQYGWDNVGNPKTPSTGSAAFGFPDGLVAGGLDEDLGYKSGSTPQAVAEDLQAVLDRREINWVDGAAAAINLPTSVVTLDEIRQEEGKVYQIGDKYYKVEVLSTQYRDVVNVSTSSAYGVKINQLATEAGLSMTGVINPVGAIEYSANRAQVILTEIELDEITYTIPANRNKTVDAPYDLIAIPYNRMYLGSTGLVEVSSNPTFTYKLVNAMINALGANLYDIQIVPYAPLEDKHFQSVSETASILLKTSFPEGEGTFYQVVNAEGPSAIIVYPTYSKFTKTVTENLNPPNDAINFKIANECDKYRLVSPNYNGQFEFSITKNGGVSAWNLTYAYRPFSPYIKVSPRFGRLYGQDFGDARGLICGGDFSITQTSDAWVQYEIQNKNYQVMFNRQIENMEVNNSAQRILDIAGAVTGTISGAVSGGITGSVVGGGPVGAIAGAVGGGLASMGGGIADVFLKEKLRKEALDFTKDQFGYQLQNIQALPYSLTKVGAFNPDNKIFPFLEYFTCTDVEKDALRNKIIYNGMTVMRIGTIEAFKQPSETYIKGKLIRLDTKYLLEDYHVINTISKELNEGVYI